MRKMILIKFNLRFLTVYIFSLVRERERIRRRSILLDFSPKKNYHFSSIKTIKCMFLIFQYKFNAFPCIVVIYNSWMFVIHIATAVVQHGKFGKLYQQQQRR